ncbi:DUF1189 family protein [Fundicoccus sp. Sow4_D5]|uniref:DUF1189 family protein n=1 Tax=unclassified Fundicoccus TaxID=2761543 RepID=UPI003F9369E9
MKYTLKILKLGLKNPRFYIEAFNLKWRYLFIISFMAMVALAANIATQALPFVNSVSNDVTASIEYIPEFYFAEGNLQLAEGEKPLYYQSNTFQLIVDDTLKSRGIQNFIPIANDKVDSISTNTLFNLLILQDQSIAVIMGNMYRIPESSQLFSNHTALNRLLLSIDSQKPMMLISIFLTALVFGFFIYWLQMLLIASVAGWFNTRLTQVIPYKLRLKLSIMASFIPLVLLQIMDAFLPFFRANYILLLFITLYIIYLAFKNHTEFVQELMKKINKNELDKREEESQR